MQTPTTLTTDKVIEAYKLLKDFIDKDIALPAQVSWDVENNYDKLKEISDHYDKKQTELLTSAMTDGKVKQVDDKVVPVEGFEDDFHELSKELNDIKQTTNDINLSMIPFSGLPDNLSVKDISALKIMIEYDT